MDITIYPGLLSGSVSAIPSKSQAHRLLICAAFADKETTLLCPETNLDIEATVACLTSLGAGIIRTERGYTVLPIRTLPAEATLNCGESGSTLRFLLPVTAALGVRTLFLMDGRLPNRPLSPLWEELERMGCRLSRPTPNTILCEGRLQPGNYRISGNVSSQFVSGLLFALPLIPGKSTLEIAGTLESAPYVQMTQDALNLFSQQPSPKTIQVEGDWSNGAFFLAAQTLGNPVSVSNLNPDSSQGDRAVLYWLEQLKYQCTINAADIPDLVPILAVTAACNRGAVFTNIHRLRLKESDRVASVVALVTGLGGKAEASEDTLSISGTGLYGGCVYSCNDHRIAMAAAIAATVCKAPVTLLSAEAVNKSYPSFWEEYARLGGKYEQHIR